MSLHVRDLVSGYGRSTVLHGVSFELRRGRVLGLLGRNGVGKSTLVLTLAGLLRARSGSVRLDDRELAGRRPDLIARAGVGLVPQGRRVWAPLTVDEHLDLAARRSRAADPTWTPERVFDVFPRLAQRRRHLGGQLSGGEQQMLAIARALLTDPTLVVLDEPSDGLAPAVVEQIGGMLTEMRAAGVTILLVEQDLHLAFAVCDELAVLEKGVIVHATDTPTFRSDPETAHRLLGVG
ncbi:ABC transporter ATP-binding protein [Qaidamihabitans albus]|uniref:ABC transporter ATP-binding protein n=1 Tax=Qaidamihabitans albus TaxID=2795733 RepID=UPI0018F1B802|nr:ABC transporter ATP-binding protein [Qaidamihabitans albus]